MKKKRKHSERAAKPITVTPEIHDSVTSCRTSAGPSWSYGRAAVKVATICGIERSVTRAETRQTLHDATLPSSGQVSGHSHRLKDRVRLNQ